MEVPDPIREDFIEILQRVCRQKGVEYAGDAAAYLIEEYYVSPNRPFRGCHPRDIVELIEDIAAFTGRQPTLSRDLIDMACHSYFVDLLENRAA